MADEQTPGARDERLDEEDLEKFSEELSDEQIEGVAAGEAG
jgi:hypothetical protein